MPLTYSAPLPPRSFNLARYCLAESARTCPEAVALIVAEDANEVEASSRWRYAALEDEVLRIAEGLRRSGFARGDRIFLRMGNSADYALLFFGANAAGLVPIPASAMLSGREAGFLIADAGAAAVVTDGTLPLPDLPDGTGVIGPDRIAALKQAPRGDYAETKADDPAFLIYTSGTQSRPKGVLHAQRAVWGRRPMYRGWYGYAEDDVVLHAGAFNWTYTLGSGLFDPWANGLTTIVYTGPKDISVWPKLIGRYGATIMAAVPTLYRQMLKYGALAPGSLAPLRHALTAGEALPQSLAQAWRERTGLVLYEALGMSEISTYISSSPSVPPKPGAVGKPQPGRAVAILDAGSDSTEPLPPNRSGLIAVHRSDPGLMLGYWNRPREEALAFRGDWFIGGDLGRFDDDGYLWFEGRADDIMNAFGYRVSPLEVESVLGRHPAVADVAVTEVKVRSDVSVIAAFFVVKPGKVLTPRALLDFAAGELAAYKLPRAAYAVAELPRTPNGKVKRSALVALMPPGAVAEQSSRAGP
ncbi:class I adenylate-forming enzyme family protein [Rhodoligotrophos defluvii]|uniref:class I adenylate-forming enzyme family protein n=1 Tax=Rhodoligotrophos defluvii TaxID=2561934 RepID=UPI0010C98D3D|nr:class I adenylate-forming enzyme family protein [Rhodoligotrophos defluvii]